MFEPRNHQAPAARLWSLLSPLGAYAPIGLAWLEERVRDRGGRAAD